MKRLMTACAICFASILLIAPPVRALSMNDGPMVWFALWNPGFEADLTQENPLLLRSGNVRFTMDPSFL
ncbi:MAG: hypothetical protein JXA20_12355 [Spirochaetes bacterium]|nr:hypothetical protein [Spirochaetota bacterium]